MSKIILLCFVLFISASLGEEDKKKAITKCPINNVLSKCGPLCPPVCGRVTCLAEICYKRPRCFCGPGGYAHLKPGGKCVKLSQCPKTSE